MAEVRNTSWVLLTSDLIIEVRFFEKLRCLRMSWARKFGEVKHPPSMAQASAACGACRCERYHH